MNEDIYKKIILERDRLDEKIVAKKIERLETIENLLKNGNVIYEKGGKIYSIKIEKPIRQKIGKLTKQK